LENTVIWHTQSGLGPKILYVNANELSLRQWCLSPARVAAEIADKLPDTRALFFEEVQYFENTGLFLKGLADIHLGIPVFATGSSSFHLLDQMRESLAGRAERLLLLPFFLNEWESEVTASSRPCISVKWKNSCNERWSSVLTLKLPSFVGGKRAEITSTPKVFFVDNGTRNLMVNQFNEFEIRADYITY